MMTSACFLWHRDLLLPPGLFAAVYETEEPRVGTIFQSEVVTFFRKTVNFPHWVRSSGVTDGARVGAPAVIQALFQIVAAKKGAEPEGQFIYVLSLCRRPKDTRMYSYTVTHMHTHIQ